MDKGNVNPREIGAANIAFTREFLATDDIPWLHDGLDGRNAHRVVFRPANAQQRMLIVPSADVAQWLAHAIQKLQTHSKDIELF